MTISESKLCAIIDHEIKHSLGLDDQLSAARTEAFQYYMGDRVGKLAPSEIADSSQVVSRDVMDTIEWIMPSLMRIFTGGDEVVNFEPVGIEDENTAQQATDWCNYVFEKQNPGFIILHHWFKDALLLKTGVVKSWWEESEEESREEYAGVTIEQIAMMQEETGGEIIEQEPLEDGTFNVAIKVMRKKGKICIENVPPEEFAFNRGARTAEGITSAHHRMQRTVSELREAGYKDVEDLVSDDSGAEWAEEATSRNDDYDLTDYGDDSLDESMRRIWLTESYLKIDFDGDGIAEWRKVLKTGKVILDNEPCDGHPFNVISPILIPHRLVGLSIADLVMDLQEIKTSMLREMIDNMRLSNSPQVYVDMQKEVNIDDLLDRRIGGIVRGYGEHGVTPLPVSQMTPLNFTMMEYVDSIRENRTGVTRYNQGIDGNSLNKTATGISAIMGAAQQRIELVARVFAETGVKDLFQRILKLTTKYENKEKIVRLRGQFVQMDPRTWANEYDVNTSVGVGTGNKDQVAMHLSNIMGVQKEMMMAGLPTVDAKRIYNTAKRLAESAGFKDGDMFFLDPESDEAKAAAQQKQQQPNPEAVKAQQEMQVQQAKLQQEGQLKQQEMQQDAQLKQQEIQLDAQLEKYEVDQRLKGEIVKQQMSQPDADLEQAIMQLTELVMDMKQTIDGVTRDAYVS